MRVPRTWPRGVLGGRGWEDGNSSWSLLDCPSSPVVTLRGPPLPCLAPEFLHYSSTYHREAQRSFNEQSPGWTQVPPIGPQVALSAKARAGNPQALEPLALVQPGTQRWCKAVKPLNSRAASRPIQCVSISNLKAQNVRPRLTVVILPAPRYTGTAILARPHN